MTVVVNQPSDGLQRLQMHPVETHSDFKLLKETGAAAIAALGFSGGDSLRARNAFIDALERVRRNWGELERRTVDAESERDRAVQESLKLRDCMNGLGEIHSREIESYMERAFFVCENLRAEFEAERLLAVEDRGTIVSMAERVMAEIRNHSDSSVQTAMRQSETAVAEVRRIADEEVARTRREAEAEILAARKDAEEKLRRMAVDTLAKIGEYGAVANSEKRRRESLQGLLDKVTKSLERRTDPISLTGLDSALEEIRQRRREIAEFRAERLSPSVPKSDETPVPRHLRRPPTVAYLLERIAAEKEA